MFDFIVGLGTAVAVGGAVCVGWKVAEPVGKRLAEAIDRGLNSIGVPGDRQLIEEPKTRLHAV